jgi:mannose-6-phosphate isomerase
MERLTGTIQPYAWGSTTFIPELLGTEPTGKPQAELWLGAHASAPSLLDGRPLDELVSEQPEQLVGRRAVAEFGATLPYLIKVLAAAEPLSLQAHPTRAQAEEGYEREEKAGLAQDDPERVYRDSWPKPEMLCALTKAETLCGFRVPAETYELFRRLGVASALELVAPLQHGGSDDLEQVFGRILRLTEDERSVIDEVADAALGHVDDDGDLGVFARTAVGLSRRHPKDPGVLAALTMNRVTLQPTEAIFLGAGNLHAYLEGSGVEIMANSDNVLRGGLTSKHVDVEELLKVLDFTSGYPELVTCVEEAPGTWRYQTPAPEFSLWRLEVSTAPMSVPADGSGRVILLTDGSAGLRSGADPLALERGQSAFLLADDRVSIDGQGTAFLAAPGVS